MTIVALDGMPLAAVGLAGRSGVPVLGALSTAFPIAGVNAATIMYGQIWWVDGGTHTIDATGSSSLQWRSGALTFANVGTNVTIGLAVVDAANGPPGRAVNTAGLITFDVSVSFAGGGGGITANAWQNNVPTTGTKTIVTGDLVAFALQMTLRGGADSVVAACSGGINGFGIVPGVTNFNGVATYTGLGQLPNCVLIANDGTYGFFYGGFVASIGSTLQNWNSGSTIKEYGNLLQFSAPVVAYGFVGTYDAGGTTNFILYSDPLGTPVAQRTVTINPKQVMTTGQASNSVTNVFFAPYTIAANTPVGVVFKPTTVTAINAPYKTFANSNHQKGESLGSGSYAINRNSGAFAAQNTNLDRFSIGLLLGGFQNGVGTFPSSYGFA